MIEKITELLQMYPKPGIIVLAILVTLITTLLTKYLTDQKRMKELRDEQKKLRDGVKEARKNNDTKKMSEINSRSIEISMEMFKHSWKPMLITAIPLLLLVGILRGLYQTTFPGWIWYYIVTSLASSIILRKVLDIA